MKLNKAHLMLFLLALSATLLIAVIPGGVLENRGFSMRAPFTIILITAFLRGLGLVSFILLPFILVQNLWALKASLIISLGYIFAYVLDLSHIFPWSSTPISTCLFWTKVIGLFIAVPLFMLSIALINSHEKERD